MITLEHVALHLCSGLALVQMHRCVCRHPDWRLSAFDLLAGLGEMGMPAERWSKVVASIAAGGELASAQVSWLAKWVMLQRRLDVERAAGLPAAMTQPLQDGLRELGRQFPGVPL